MIENHAEIEFTAAANIVLFSSQFSIVQNKFCVCVCVCERIKKKKNEAISVGFVAA